MPRPENVSDKDPEDPRSDADMEIEWAMQVCWNAEKPRKYVGDGAWRDRPPTAKQLTLVNRYRLDMKGCTTSGDYSDVFEDFFRTQRADRARGFVGSTLATRLERSLFGSRVFDYVDHLLGVAEKHHG